VRGLRLAGALWIIAGIVCAGLLVFVLIGENLETPGILLNNAELRALVFGGAVVGLLIGVLLRTRPSPGVVRWSSFVGMVWLIVFGPLVLGHHDTPGPLLSSSLITGFGVAGALVAYLSRGAVRVDRPRRDTSHGPE